MLFALLSCGGKVAEPVSKPTAIKASPSPTLAYRNFCEANNAVVVLMLESALQQKPANELAEDVEKIADVYEAESTAGKYSRDAENDLSYLSLLARRYRTVLIDGGDQAQAQAQADLTDALTNSKNLPKCQVAS
jgi:hypothetical protein